MQSRQSRMEKYFTSEEDNQSTAKNSRIKKNQALYKEVSNLELEDFDLNSNVSILGDNSSNINLDEIKDILDKKYHENPKRKSFGDSEETMTKLNLDETREYDINSILEKAKENKEVNYEEERLKKIRNTQYDILKSLDILNNEEEIEEKPDTKAQITVQKKESKEESERKLKELIDTITAKELIKQEENLEVTGELDPFDLFGDLKGDDENTRVMGMLAEELREAEKENSEALATMKEHKMENTLGIENPDDEEEINENSADVEDESDIEEGTNKVEIKKTPEEIQEENLRKTQALQEFDKEIEEEMQKRAEEHKNHHHKSENLSNTNTLTNTMSFTQSDFDDFIDLKEDMQVTKIIVRILIVIIIIVFVIGLVVLANNYLGLGLF